MRANKPETNLPSQTSQVWTNGGLRPASRVAFLDGLEPFDVAGHRMEVRVGPDCSLASCDTWEEELARLEALFEGASSLPTVVVLEVRGPGALRIFSWGCANEVAPPNITPAGMRAWQGNGGQLGSDPSQKTPKEEPLRLTSQWRRARLSFGHAQNLLMSSQHPTQPDLCWPQAYKTCSGPTTSCSRWSRR